MPPVTKTGTDPVYPQQAAPPKQRTLERGEKSQKRSEEVWVLGFGGPVSAKAAPQSAGSKEEQNIKERPTTVKREQSQSARAKEPVTKQQEVRTQVARESSSPAATPKHSGTVTDMPRQTVKHQKQTKTVQKKTTNPSTMKKTTSRKGGKK